MLKEGLRVITSVSSKKMYDKLYNYVSQIISPDLIADYNGEDYDIKNNIL